MFSSSLSDLTEQRDLAAAALAYVVSQLFPHAILRGGGIHSLGFYYDFIFEKPLTESMLELIEVNLHRLIKEKHPIRFISIMRENAQALFEHHQHFLLAEQAAEQKANILELVQIGDFYSLCPPLALTQTQEIGHVKLLDAIELTQVIQEEEIQVTRLVGICQRNAKDLKKILKTYDSFLKKRDHRLLGPKLNLFHFSQEIGNLGVIWHPKGVQLRQILLHWLYQQSEEEAVISTPLVGRQEFLGADSLALEPFLFEGEEYRLRSSLERQHLAFLRHFPLESEELPWRMTEQASVFYQYPESQWWGLFCQCAYLTCHTTLVCNREQVALELISSLHFIEQIITIFGFEAQWYLIASRQKSSSTRQEQEAIEWLKKAIQAQPLSYSYFPELQEKEGQMPHLELRIRDVLGREWPVSRLSVMPSVSSQQGEEPRRVILTRRICDSLDRLVALLIEHYAGVFPLWLAPEQVRVLVIGEANRTYAQQVSQRLKDKGLRVKLDMRQAKLGFRVHEAEKENVPYLVLIGEQERMKQRISVREAGRLNQSLFIETEAFLNKIYQESLCPMPRGLFAK